MEVLGIIVYLVIGFTLAKIYSVLIGKSYAEMDENRKALMVFTIFAFPVVISMCILIGFTLTLDYLFKKIL